MASIRRTLSPAKHDRTSHPNGSAALSPLSVGSPAHQFLSDSKPSGSTSFSAVFFGIRRSLLSLFCQKQTTRRGFGHQQSWRRSILRCMICFLVGLLLGLLPFGRIDDMKIRDFTFERKSETSIHVEELKQEIKSQQQTEIVMSKEEDEVATVALSEYEIKERFDFHPRDLLIVVTPTYNRALQGYYLNRLGQALRLVNPPILWIVVEMNAQSTETADILRKMGIMYRHLVCTKNMTDIKDRGVQQRNTALEHIERHRLDGVVYFADDDNIYSLELFERIRKISRFGTWPVAMLAQGKNKAILEGPVCNNTQVIGWHTNEKSARLRRFHVDMSGFAFNSTILWDPRRWNRPFLEPVRQLDTVREGFQETTFIEQLVAEESQMEGLPDGCGNIMNWHIHIEAHNAVYPSGWLLRNNLDVVLPLDRDNEDTTTA